MNDLSTDARALVEAGRTGDQPEQRDKARVRARLAQQLGAGAFAGAAVLTVIGTTSSPPLSGTATIAPAAARVGSALWVKTLGTAAAVVATAGAIYTGSTLVSAPPPKLIVASPALTPRAERGTEPTVEQLRLPREPVTEALPSDERVTALGEPKKAERRHRRRQAREEAAAASPDSTLTAELTLLAKAQRALRARRADDALTYVREHAARFPEGTLEEERAGIEALAHCMRDDPHHRSGARAFLTRSPDSPLAARVRKECDSK